MTTNSNESDINSIILNDDCLRQVFTYLTLKDRIRLERVSKQFKNWIYFEKWCLNMTNDSVPNIINDYYVVNIDLFRSVCQKCTDITTIVCSNVKNNDYFNVLVNESVLDVITEFCSKLKVIYFSVNDVTEEAITRFGQRLGHRLEVIFFFNADSSQENQQIFIKHCPNLKKLVCGYLQTINVIDSVEFKDLRLPHYHMWSESEVQAFAQFVDRYHNQLTRLGISSRPDVNHFSGDILRHVRRFTNLEVFDFRNNSKSLSQIISTIFEDLGSVRNNLKKVILDFSSEDFDLWHTFRHFDGLEVLKILGFESVLRDSILPIKPLVTLKKLELQCVSIGFYFFEDVTEFCPYVKVLSICAHSPRHQLKNHCLTALSECKQLKKLEIEMPNNIRVFENEEFISYHLEVDDIGIFRLLDNCRDIEQIRFLFKTSQSMITSLVKWMESEDNSPKKIITLEFVPSKDMISNGLADLSLLNNIKRLRFKIVNEFLTPNDFNQIIIQLDKDSKISVDLTTYLDSYKDIDIWHIFCRNKDLEELIFRYKRYIFDNLKPNIEPLMSLEQITIECLYFDDFDNIAKLAPNLEEFRLFSRFFLKNRDLIELSKLKYLTKINLMSCQKTDHSSDDIGVIQLLDCCLRLKEVLFDFQVNISSKTIDKLRELANNRPKEIIKFRCFVNSSELQSNRLIGVPKNLFIQTKFNEN